MKILLLGKNGQVGRELRRTLLPFGDVMAVGRDQVDLENAIELAALLNAETPDIIVNAAAYTAVDLAEDEESKAFRINAEAVGELAAFAFEKGSLLVHYSTDYVFDGNQQAAYKEADGTAPQGAYGRSKLAGERAIAESGCKHLTFRTSWVYSSQGHNFVKTILRLATQRESLNIVADQVGAPTSAELIADVTALALLAYRKGSLQPGIYHLTANGETSWYGLACHAVARARAIGMQLKLDIGQIRAITTEEYPTLARRPKNSRLCTGSLSAVLGLQLPDWRIHVDRTVDQLKQLEPV